MHENKDTERYQRLRSELREMCDSHPLFLLTTAVENLLIEVHNS